MADRTVRVTLTAQVAGYLQGMDRAAKATQNASSEAQKLAARGQAFGDLGRMALVGGAVVAAGLAVAIAKFAEFDQAMSQVQAATQESASNMVLLRDAAIVAGAKTVYSATQAANAIEELGKAGLTTAQIVGGGLDGALTLAAAGGISVADAAGFAAIAMKQFGLEGSQIPHVADLLAAGAGKAVGDVDDLAQALNQAGLIANGAGFSIEETTGVLAAFADAGLLGSDAGTSLKTAIISLQSPSAKAKAALEEYGLSVYDANGNMASFEDIAGQLQSKLGGLTDEQRNSTLATIFGTDAIRAANVLYTQGAVGIKKYVDQTNDSGYAAKVAADRMNNLSGDIEQLGGSFDTALIKSGSGANDVLRELVQSATFLVNAFGDLPEPVLGVGLAVTVAAAAILLVGGAALVAVPKFVSFKLTLDRAEISLGSFATKTALAGGAVAIATLAIGYFVGRAAEAAANTAEFKDSLDQTTGALTDYTRELVIKKLTESGAYGDAKRAGVSQKELTKAVLEGGDALEKVQAKLSKQNNIVDFFNGSGIAAGNATSSINELRGSVVQSKKDFEDQEAATEDAAESTDTAAEAYTNAADQAQGLNDNLTNLIDTINKANGVGQDAVSTNSAYQQALVEVDAAIRNIDPATGKAKDSTDALVRSVDESTAAGAENAAMFADLAEKSQTAADAQFALDGNTTAYQANLVAGHQALYDQILALTGNADAAQALADKIYAIPSEADFKIIADTAAANAAIDATTAKLAHLKDIFTASPVAGAGLGVLKKPEPRADGGAISGPGSGTSDTAGLFALSNGEHVLTAADVAAAGGQGAIYAWRNSLHSGRGYANGGAVNGAYASSGGSVVNKTGPTVVINEVTNADGTAQAVLRRLNMGGA